MTQTTCSLCPRACGADRARRPGFCGGGALPRLARAGLHFWEEPCISGEKGSGAVFFSGCVLRCCFCQNHEISAKNFGKEVSISRLGEIFLRLAEEGAHNINLVNPTHYVPQIIKALDAVKGRLSIPVVYNSGGYESVETIKMLKGYVDIFLPDFKYVNSSLSQKYSGAKNYFAFAQAAILQMVRQSGPPVFSQGLMKSGTIIRHLVLPGCADDSIKVMRCIAQSFSPGEVYVSIMRQFVPCYQCALHPELNRRVTTYEYRRVTDEAARLGLLGYTQERNSADIGYTPSFDLSGL